ncbi:MAG: enoyl-CoA hydratase/isomerase family protein [Bradyrhizobiaceae bacterium]|nr:MAG: enoyl-CoA hydratase/isomerase family protein [Bradyrhizobiaceae bacterium]
MTVQPTAFKSDGDMVVLREGSAGVLLLNRPKALNALTLDMVRVIERALDEFEADPAIATVLLEGAGERGLCAGGDIRSLRDSAREGGDLGPRFWTEEYRLNARIAAFPKPFAPFMDGVVMGGGIGLAGHSSHRITTERSIVAMPEVSLGFFPDVGGTYLLSHMPGEIGTYYTLTGNTMSGAEAVYVGLADVRIATKDWPTLRKAITQLPPGAAANDVMALLKTYSSPGPVPIADHKALIDRIFAQDSVEGIVASLEQDGSDFARKTRDEILEKSPRGLKLALRLLRLGRASSSLKEVLQREYRAVLEAYTTSDFVEGIRAALVDKDRNPKWSPPRLEDVTPPMIDRYLAPLGANELKF